MTREEAASMLLEEVESITKCWERIGVKMPESLQTANEGKRIAVAALLENNWCDVREQLPPEGELVLVLATAKIGSVDLRNAYELALYHASEDNWELETYPDCEDAQIRWWMPLPEAPQETE